MSRVTDGRQSELTADGLLEAAGRAGARINYKLRGQSTTALVFTQPFFDIFDSPMAFLVTGWPAKITVTVTPEGSGSRADILVTNFGFGPVQTNHCRKQLRRYIEALEAALYESGQALARAPGAGEQPPARGPDEMYCTSCGAVIKTDSQFCTRCGTRVAG